MMNTCNKNNTMKKIIIPFLGMLLLIFAACNNENNNTNPVPTTKTKADTLLHDVMEGHNEAMAKMGKLNRMELEVLHIIDSIGKLPRKTKTTLKSYIKNLDIAVVNIRAAKMGMDNWMEAFNMDSAITNKGERIKYLEDERLKVTKVKESILTSLANADSLIRK